MLGKPPAQSPAANQAAFLFAHFYFLSLCLGGQERKPLTLKSSMAIFRYLSFSPSKACYSFHSSLDHLFKNICLVSYNLLPCYNFVLFQNFPVQKRTRIFSSCLKTVAFPILFLYFPLLSGLFFYMTNRSLAFVLLHD
jgi:hypothetical protein